MSFSHCDKCGESWMTHLTACQTHRIIATDNTLSLKEFDEASNHPYECRCKICEQWWKEMPEEQF